MRASLRALALLGLGLPLAAAGGPDPEPGARGGTGLALHAAKILVCSYDGPQVVDDGMLLVHDGKIVDVGRAQDVRVPIGYEVLDVGERWLAPGLVDLHCHEAGESLYSGVNDLNDLVYLANPEMRASASVEPGNQALKMGIAGGVTTVLYIPGSGSNIGGQGVLLKTAFDTYEEKVVRNPGSMKLAQWGNPEAWAMGVGMSFENWNTRDTLRRGIAYAKRWEAFEKGEGEEPERNLMFDVFRDLVGNQIAISTHTQVYQVVLMTLTMVHGELALPVFLDHSTIGGWLAAPIAARMGVAAICGPRSVDTPSRGFINWARNRHEGFRGIAAGWQQGGEKDVGFNTDSPVVPQEELHVQAAMGVHYGFDDSELAALRGLTIIPARTAKIDARVGSLEPGKDADILVVDGHPIDPRTTVWTVFVDGKRAYDAGRDGRRW